MRLIILIALTLTGCSIAAIEKKSALLDETALSQYKNSRNKPIVGRAGMVVSEDAEAASWGVEILKRGGNAVDAAVATAFALSVTRPEAGSLGGGGFMLFCPKPENYPSPCVVIDYREQAPASATRDMFVKDGKSRTDLSQNSALASGVPGVVAGLLLALEKYGKKSRHEVLRRPIELARDGIRVMGGIEAAANYRWPAMNDEAKRIFGCDSKGRVVPTKPCEPGALLKQTDLARTLQEVSARGKKGFYEGWVAKKIARAILEKDGAITEKDLASYEPKVRTPAIGGFRSHEIVTMPPPSSGGVILLQLLSLIDRMDRDGHLETGPLSAHTIHALAHAMALGFADRALFFGDPDFTRVPVQELLKPEYLDQRWVDTFKSGHVAPPAGAGELAPEGMQTTHFSVIDREGNAVAVTTTINDHFGNGFVPPGTGVVMNNEMDDFSIEPGVPNLFGLVGAEANAVAAGKRPLSSMSPTIVRDLRGNAEIVIGAAGGPRIITSVALSLMNRYRFGMTLPDAVSAPRFHHQWKPEKKLVLESGSFSAEAQAELREGYGYIVEEVLAQSRIHALERFPATGRVWGVPDPRGEGVAVAETLSR